MKDSCPTDHQLSLYHDGQLLEQELSTCEVHLRDCLDCRRKLSQYQTIDKVVVNLEDTAKFRATPRSWLPIVSAAAAVFLVVGLTWFVRPQTPTTTKKQYAFSGDGDNYTVSLEGEAYLVSLQVGDIKTVYDDETKELP